MRLQANEPLFPDIFWNRPVAKQSAGRLLICGGHASDFSLPTALFELADAAGIGQVTAVLPDSLRKVMPGAAAVVFVPSSPSGSLGRLALGEITELAREHDAILLAGLSNNSETSALAESIARLGRPLVLAGDAIGSVQPALPDLVNDHRVLLITDWPQLLKLSAALGSPVTIKRGDLLGKAAIIADMSTGKRCSFLVIGPELLAANAGEVTATPLAQSAKSATITAALAAVFWTQNPAKPLEALTSAAFVVARTLARQPASTPELAKAIRSVLGEL